MPRVVVLFALLQTVSIPAEFVVASFFTPAYNWVQNTISDLGATTCTTVPYPHGDVPVCSPLHPLMNGSMILGGAALIGLAITARRLPGFQGLAGIAWIVGGLSTMATGLIPLDVNLEVHTLVSLPVFLISPLAVILGARQWHGIARSVGLVIGVATLVVGVTFTVWIGGSAYGGLLERAVLWPSILWAAAQGIGSATRFRGASSASVPESV